MAATVTLSKVLQLAAKLTASEQAKLVDAVKARQRKRAAWLKRLEKDAKQAVADSKAGKLRGFSSAKEITAYMREVCGTPDE